VPLVTAALAPPRSPDFAEARPIQTDVDSNARGRLQQDVMQPEGKPHLRRSLSRLRIGTTGIEAFEDKRSPNTAVRFPALTYDETWRFRPR